MQRGAPHSLLTGATALLIVATLHVATTPLVFALTDTPTATATAAAQPSFSLSPADQSVPLAAGSASVDVLIQNASDVAAFQFLLRYDPGVLTQPIVQPGPFLGSAGRSVYCLPPVIDGPSNGPGTLLFGCVTMGQGQGAGGSGVLATVTFAFTGSGETSISLERLGVGDSLGNSYCPCAGQGGSIDVTAPTPNPTPTTTSTPRPVCVGDVNNDGVINALDLTLVARHMGTHSGSKRYDPRYDLNHDGRINVLDLLIVLRRRGIRCA